MQPYADERWVRLRPGACYYGLLLSVHTLKERLLCLVATRTEDEACRALLALT